MPERNKLIVVTFFTSFIYLCICTYTDMKKQLIPLIISAIFCVAGFFLYLFGYTAHQSIPDLLLSICSGIILLILTIISKSSIGAGDGIMIITTGFFYPFCHNIAILLYSFITMALFALFLIIFKKYSGKYRLPFAPFLLSGFLTYHILFHFFN